MLKFKGIGTVGLISHNVATPTAWFFGAVVLRTSLVYNLPVCRLVHPLLTKIMLKAEVRLEVWT